LTFDPSGNLVIADTGNALIRVIDKTTGLIHSVAGTTTPVLGTGGAAVGAYLFAPNSMVFDPAGSGSIIFTDSAPQGRLWIMDKSGLISSLAGGGAPGVLGDGGPAANAGFQGPSGLALDKKGAYYIADTGNNRIRKIDAKGIVSTVAGTTIGRSLFLRQQ
jgi:sugar lactone lactonase YvrE